MKHTSLILCILLLALTVGGCAPGGATPESVATDTVEPSPAEAQGDGPWEVILQREIEQPMRVAAFLGGDFGVTGGPSDPGRAHYTTDGGQTWTMAESSVA